MLPNVKAQLRLLFVVVNVTSQFLVTEFELSMILFHSNFTTYCMDTVGW